MHAYSETLTVILRRLVVYRYICVDLAKLLQMCVDNGVLRATGTSPERLKGFVNNSHQGIPLQGFLPIHFLGDPRDQVKDPLADICVKGSELYKIKAVPLPFGTPTPEQAEAAMHYRELLCDILDKYPVIICFPLQKHYQKRREEGEPYRRLQGDHHYVTKNPRPWWYFGLFDSKTERVRHCVTAYGYDCPGGDVRTMRIHYQENATGAPDDQPGRHVMDPDAVEYYYVPLVGNAYFTDQ